MVGSLVRLQLTLYWRALRSSRGAIVSLVLGCLYGLAILVGVIGSVIGLARRPVADRATVLVAFFSVVVLMRLFLLFTVGQEQSLDPARFALLPVRARQLLPGLLAAAFATPGPWFLVALVALSSLVFRDTPSLLVATLACGALGLVLSTLMCRVMVRALSGVLHARRFRDLASIVVMLVAMSAGVVSQGISRALESSGTLAEAGPVAAVLGWTPLGWPWAIVADAARHAWLPAGVRLLLTLAACAVLWWAWGRLLDRALTSPLEAGGAAARVRSGRLADRLAPRTPAGALTARVLRYYRRDPRHVMQLLVMVVLPLLIVMPSLTGSDAGLRHLGRGALIVPMFVGLMVGSSSLAQELALDGSALWMQLVASLPGRADRWGRLLAFLYVSVPAVLAIDIAFGLLVHQPGRLLVIVGASLGSLGASCAVGLVAGALVQVPQPPPGASPFARRSGGGLEAALVSLASLFVGAVLEVPFVVAAWVAWDRSELGWLPLLLALLACPPLLWGGCVWGGRILDRSWPEVLARIGVER